MAHTRGTRLARAECAGSTLPLSNEWRESEVAETVAPKVRLIAKTEFFPPEDVPWTTDADGGQALVEFAGRACYQ